MHTPESPFPFTTKSGAVIVDERCSCGALRSQHETTIAYGHGPRVVAGAVTCSRYTFVRWVFTSRALPAGFEALDDKHAVRIERASKRDVGASGWRYEVRDMSAKLGGAKLFTCKAPKARTSLDALRHAREELRIHLERQPELGGIS
ncbi:MAG TPA: hypothetical protein VMZ53_03600 [Kofleriaceae bacterium]|nr:hypothetical protein [Kofleriaceae bacterium]